MDTYNARVSEGIFYSDSKEARLVLIHRSKRFLWPLQYSAPIASWTEPAKYKMFAEDSFMEIILASENFPSNTVSDVQPSLSSRR